MCLLINFVGVAWLHGMHGYYIVRDVYDNVLEGHTKGEGNSLGPPLPSPIPRNNNHNY